MAQYLVAVDGSKNGEAAFDAVMGRARGSDHVFVLKVAEEVYASNVAGLAGASGFFDYTHVSHANSVIEEQSKTLLKAFGRRLTERSVRLPNCGAPVVFCMFKCAARPCVDPAHTVAWPRRPKGCDLARGRAPRHCRHCGRPAWRWPVEAVPPILRCVGPQWSEGRS